MAIKVGYGDMLVEKLETISDKSSGDMVRGLIGLAKETLGDLPKRMDLTIILHEKCEPITIGYDESLDELLLDEVVNGHNDN